MNSRQKGSRGEREAAKYLISLGFDGARRAQQFAGGVDSSDVVCPGLAGVHIEVKFGYSRSAIDIGTSGLRKACLQALRDSGGVKPWVVLWRPPRTFWRLTYEDRGWQVTVGGDDTIRSVLGWLNDSVSRGGGE